VSEARKHFYRDVPGIGNVAVSRHAQDRMIELGISQAEFDLTLFEPSEPDIPEGSQIVWRVRYGVRLIIVPRPTPFRGAALVKTIFRIKPQQSAI
jgi:hypothetical protein